LDSFHQSRPQGGATARNHMKPRITSRVSMTRNHLAYNIPNSGENLKVAGSNPAPAPNCKTPGSPGVFAFRAQTQAASLSSGTGFAAVCNLGGVRQKPSDRAKEETLFEISERTASCHGAREMGLPRECA